MPSGSLVHVALQDRSYDILIGNGLYEHLPNPLPRWLTAEDPGSLRMLLVADESVYELHGRQIQHTLEKAGVQVEAVEVPHGETSKSFAMTQRLYDALVNMQADRKTAVIAVGGGVVGDLAGFAAATYARGLRFLQVPTTLLAMVDSSVGGKTGINHPQGKNLIGAFHQPAGVLIDTDSLSTLPDRDYRAGLAEVVKYGVILDAEFFAWLENNVDELCARDSAAVNHVVRRSCELKAEVVTQDERETLGLRAILNYGHTFAHAFEALAGYGTLLHGEAVAVGMLCASRLAESLGRISASCTQRQHDLLKALGLPVSVPDELQSRRTEIVDRMMLDKKTENRQLRFILPTRLGEVEIVTGVEPEVATDCLV